MRLLNITSVIIFTEFLLSNSLFVLHASASSSTTQHIKIASHLMMPKTVMALGDSLSYSNLNTIDSLIPSLYVFCHLFS